MAALSYANAWAQLTDYIHIFEELEKYVTTGASSYETLEDALRANTLGDYALEGLRDIYLVRDSLSSALSPATVRRVLSGPLLDMGRAIDAPERDPAGIMRRLYDYMHANSLSVNAAGFTRGAASAGGSNIGNGSIHRITTDKNGYELSASHRETKTMLCVADQNQTDKHREVFEVRGVEANRDFVTVAGSGIVTSVRCLSIADSQQLLRNPGFDQFSGTQPTAGSPSTPSATTSITGWTLDSTTSVTVGIDTPAVYRTPVGETAAKWMAFAANRTATQVLNTVTRGKLRTDVPYFFQLAVYRESSADGTLTITVGNTSRAVTVTTLNNGAWNVVTVPATIGQNNWYKALAKNDVSVAIAWASRTTGTLYFDDVIWAPMTRIDGAYLAAVGGATPFRVDDTFTIADTQSSRAVVDYWLTFRSGLGIILPSATSGETVSDP